MRNAPKDGASGSKPTPSTEVATARRQSDSIDVKTHGVHMHEDVRYFKFQHSKSSRSLKFLEACATHASRTIQI